MEKLTELKVGLSLPTKVLNAWGAKGNHWNIVSASARIGSPLYSEATKEITEIHKTYFKIMSNVEIA